MEMGKIKWRLNRERYYKKAMEAKTGWLTGANGMHSPRPF